MEGEEDVEDRAGESLVVFSGALMYDGYCNTQIAIGKAKRSQR